MPTPHIPDHFEMLVAFVISLISGTISIARRILMGQESTILWVISEFLTAILCGYLMYNAYPALDPWIPDFVTLPVAVAFVAHSGGRIFQEVENAFLEHTISILKKRRGE